MPELNTFACEVCGTIRREVNRWWMVFAITEEAPTMLPPTEGSLRKRFNAGFVCVEFDAEVWAQAIKEGLSRAVACGEEHAQQLFARWLVSGSFDAPSQRPIARSAATPACPEPAERGCADEQVPQTGMPALQDPPTGKEEA